MKIFKNRTALGIICILLAVLIVLVVIPAINKATEGKVEIVRATKDIPHGKLISKDDVTTITVGSFNLPDDVIKSLDDVVGKYATTDIKCNDYFTVAKISNKLDTTESVLKSLNDNNRAISITIDSFASGLSGKILKDDIVSIIVVGGSKEGAFIPSKLKYMRVITTTEASGKDINAPYDEESRLPTTITLFATEEQCRLLAEYEANGKIHIVLVSRGDDEAAEKYLEAQQEILDKVEEPEESEETSDFEESGEPIEDSRDESDYIEEEQSFEN